MKRIVIKIGTNLLTGETLCGLRIDLIKDLAKQIAALKKMGKEILIVTSGAIGAGCTELNMKKSREIEARQALAAVGQGSVMRVYHDAFAKYNIKVGQILLTYEDFSNRKRYLNLRKALNKLLGLSVVPIINENDPISVDEIGATFGDNDKLSALVASKVNADLLIILSDIDGLFDKNPKTNKDAKLIRNITQITKQIEKAAGKSGSSFAVGGMITKIKAAKIALDSGCNVIICNGNKKRILLKALKSEEGTLFVSKQKLSNRDRWIKFSNPKGIILVNKYAENILRNGKASLLAVGIESLTGNFEKGAVVQINEFAKGITDYSSQDIKETRGIKGKVIIKSENIVLI
jgi:glutamate 5-kinase